LTHQKTVVQCHPQAKMASFLAATKLLWGKGGGSPAFHLRGEKMPKREETNQTLTSPSRGTEGRKFFKRAACVRSVSS